MINLIPHSVSILILRTDGKILGVSRKNDENAFGLPGGKIDLGESLTFAAIREFTEETGSEISPYSDIPLIHSGFCPGGEDGIAYFNHTFMPIEVNLSGLKQKKGEGRLAWVPPIVLAYGPFKYNNQRMLQTVGLFDPNDKRLSDPDWAFDANWVKNNIEEIGIDSPS